MIKLTQTSPDHNGSAEKDGLNRRRIHLREISGDSDTPLETVGQDLRAARLRRGDEIAHVSRALKIRKDHLEALEEDRLDDLPGKTYAIGFVRSYARHLGLDADRYVERFKQEIAGRSEEQSREPAAIHREESRHYLPYGWRIIAGVVVLLLGYGVWHVMAPSGDTSQQVPEAPALNPPKPKPAAALRPVVAPAQEATPSPATDAVPPAMPGASGQQASATPPPAAGAKTPVTGAAQMGASPVPPAAPPQSPMAQAAPSQPVLPPPSPRPAMAPDAATPGQVFGAGAGGGSRVVLRARGPARVTVKGPDGTILLNRNLAPGDSYQAPNIPGVTLATSDAGALDVDLDGVALGRVGQPQQILGRVSLDPQSLSDRFNSR